jgi:3-hydroxy-9,10-secoandrosta-1,3,5(10)-triene-9,17-dione monooxygenase reductase component
MSWAKDLRVSPASHSCRFRWILRWCPSALLGLPAHWPLLRASRSFTVNILAAEHHHLSNQCAEPGTDTVAGVAHSASPLGNPVLDGALAWMDCELHQEYDGGDQTIVVAAIRALGSRPGSGPLLFFKGSYVTDQLRAEALTRAA